MTHYVLWQPIMHLKDYDASSSHIEKVKWIGYDILVIGKHRC